ncbi:MAG: hypothetical protein JO122_20330 [Acetobacteraceae bacterium]|nr:hypothetical protein [Acetobacteraceae bacterium]
MTNQIQNTRRGLVGGSALLAMTAALSIPGADATTGNWGKPRKLVWVPQALGDWDS